MCAVIRTSLDADGRDSDGAEPKKCADDARLLTISGPHQNGDLSSSSQCNGCDGPASLLTDCYVINVGDDRLYTDQSINQSKIDSLARSQGGGAGGTPPPPPKLGSQENSWLRR